MNISAKMENEQIFFSGSKHISLTNGTIDMSHQNFSSLGLRKVIYRNNAAMIVSNLICSILQQSYLIVTIRKPLSIKIKLDYKKPFACSQMAQNASV